MSSSIFYGGIPIDEVDFEKEFDKELQTLKEFITALEERKVNKGDKFNHKFWTMKLNRANKSLEQGTISLD